MKLSKLQKLVAAEATISFFGGRPQDAKALKKIIKDKVRCA